MGKIQNIDQLKKWIEQNYDPSNVGGQWWDTGNYDDSYEYGQENGVTWTLYKIGSLLGMDLEMPDEVEMDI